MNETADSVLADTVEILTAEGWQPRHRTLTAPDGQAVAHLSADTETVTVNLEYGPGVLVEIFHLDITTTATRIARIILTAAEPIEEI